MSEYSTSGIPTLYKHRQYRSRLEARWACFFDLLGWRYEYEPCDFEGWIPDFVLYEASPVFVEVKPVTTFPEDVATKIDGTSCGHEALIVGMTLLHGSQDAPIVGWLRQDMALYGPNGEGMEQGWDWAEAPFGVWSSTSPDASLRVGFCHEIQSFRDRITGKYDGGCWGEQILDIPRLYQLWAEAGNTVQWIARTTLKTTLSQGFYPLRSTL